MRLFETIVEAMAQGDRVELRGFGSFSLKQRDARLGRNPRTGANQWTWKKSTSRFSRLVSCCGTV